MPLPAAIPYVVAALGGGALWAWVSASDDEWADADVFNPRMKEIHLGILQLNDLIARCKVSADSLTAWRNFVTLWADFYRGVGTVSFSPSTEVILEAKHKAATLAKWLDNYVALCGPLPTGVVPVDTTPSDKPTNWGNLLMWAVFISTGGYVLASYYGKKSP